MRSELCRKEKRALLVVLEWALDAQCTVKL